MTSGRVLATSSLPADESAFGEVRCGQCRGVLECHQPDVELPQRMLLTCGGCGSWYVLEVPKRRMLAFPRFQQSRLSSRLRRR